MHFDDNAKSFRLWYYNKFVIPYVLLVIYFILSFLFFKGQFINIVYNLRSIIATFSLVLYLTIYLNKRDIKNVYKKLFIPLNVYFLLNIMAAYLELKGYTWVSGVTRRLDFKFNFIADSVSGLFGLYGVPVFGYFRVFIIIYNYFYFRFYSNINKTIKIIYQLLTIGLILLFFLLMTSVYLFVPSFERVTDTMFINYLNGQYSGGSIEKVTTIAYYLSI